MLLQTLAFYYLADVRFENNQLKVKLIADSNYDSVSPRQLNQTLNGVNFSSATNVMTPKGTNSVFKQPSKEYMEVQERVMGSFESVNEMNKVW